MELLFIQHEFFGPENSPVHRLWRKAYSLCPCRHYCRGRISCRIAVQLSSRRKLFARRTVLCLDTAGCCLCRFSKSLVLFYEPLLKPLIMRFNYFKFSETRILTSLFGFVQKNFTGSFIFGRNKHFYHVYANNVYREAFG
jgi:hypothetical protein